MANVNALIAAGPHTQGIDVRGNAAVASRIQSNEKRNQLIDLQTQEFNANAPAREDARLMASLKVGSQLAIPYIQQNDDVGLVNYLKARKVTLDATGSDTTHTGEAIAALESGDPAQVAQAKQLLTQFATMGDEGDAPTNQMRNAAAAGLQPGTPEYNAAVLPAASAAPKEPERVRLAQAAGLQPGTPEFNDYVLNRGGADGERQRTEEIKAAKDILLRTTNEATGALYTPQEAHDRAVIATDRNEQLSVTSDGRLLTTDLLTGSTRQDNIQRERPDRVSLSVPSEQSLYASSKEGSGMWNAITRVAARTAGQVNADTDFAEEEIQAASRMGASGRTLIRSLSLSKRYPEGEAKRIEKTFNLMADWKTPDTVYKKEAVALSAWLSREIARAEIDYRDSDSAEYKNDANRTARDMRSLLVDIGVPLEKREDIRSYAMATEGFFDWDRATQQEYIDLKTREQLLKQGKLNESN